jgi:hypothetical protein
VTARDFAERTAGLVRFGAWAAITAGALRVASAFIPYRDGSAGLELFYGVIDLGLTYGLIAIYIASAEAVGLVGLASFLVALAGLASIVGPDSIAFGIDFYRVGALVFVAGLAGISIQLLRARVLRISASLWVLTFIAGLASPLLPQASLFAGTALGAGYILAGHALVRTGGSSRQHDLAAPKNEGNPLYKSEGNRLGKLARLNHLPAEIAGNRTLNPMASAPDLYSDPSVSQEGS